MDKYEVYPYDTIAAALKESRKNKGGWTGPNKIHSSIGATSPVPSWHLSEEGLEYHKERGRGFQEVLVYVAFMMGYHNGATQESKHVDVYMQRVETYQNICDLLRAENRKLRGEPEVSPEDTEQAKADLAAIWADVLSQTEDTDNPNG